MDVSVIIINYNTRELVLKCLESVFAETKGVAFEVILVDNASTDNSCVAIKNKFPSVRLIESNENLGFGRANNLAAAVALGEYLFFLNSDTVLLNDSISIFLYHMNVIPNVAICGGSLFLKKGLPTHSYGRFPTLGNDIFYSLNLDKIFKTYVKWYKENLFSVITEVDYITGADMFISRKIFNEIGLFDEDFFMYYEEVELTHRVKEKKFKVIFIPDAQIIHYGQMNNISNEKLKIYFTSKFLYFKKTKGIFNYLCVKYWWIFVFIIRFFILLRKRELLYIKTILSIQTV